MYGKCIVDVIFTKNRSKNSVTKYTLGCYCVRKVTQLILTPMKKDEQMHIRYSSEDLQKLRNKAKEVGLNVSTYVRHVSLKSLKNG